MQLVGVVLCIIIIIEVDCLPDSGGSSLVPQTQRRYENPPPTHHAANSKLHNLHICGGHGLPHAFIRGAYELLIIGIALM